MSRGRDSVAAELAVTLDVLAAAAGGLQDQWWLFGGAAMVLLGLDDLKVPDVDVLASETDALRLLEALGGERVGEAPVGQFRSKVFGKATSTPLVVEVMAGLEVHSAGAWTAVRPRTRVPLPWGAHQLFVPDAAEQAAICRTFGRPKDLTRAVRLDALAVSG